MRQLKLKVGDRIKHNARGSEYRVIFSTSCNLVKTERDNGESYFWLWSDSYETYDAINSRRPATIDARDEVVGCLPLIVQISNTTERYGPVLIYQCLSDNRIWARHADEFTTDRFTRIK